MSRIVAALVASASLLAVASAAFVSPAMAREEDPNPSARLDATLRPHFDYFLWRKQHHGGRPMAYRPRMPLLPSYSVDCAAGDSINYALSRLADNGVLYVRSTGACREPVFVYFPVTIVGQPASPFDGASSREAMIAPPPGAPCIEIDPSVKHVEIRDLTVDGSQGGRESCVIVGDRAELFMSGVKINYTGQASAIRAGRGKLLINDGIIEANSYDPAIVTDGARVAIWNTTIRTGAVGMQLTPGPDGQVDLSYVSLLAATGANDATNFADTGLIARGAGSAGGRVLISHSDISGYRTGVRIERGIKADIGVTRIRHARVGVLSEAEELTVTNSALAALTGVSVTSGHAWIERNRFVGFLEKPFEFDVGGEVVTNYNWFDPKRGCVPWPHLHPWCGPTPDIVMMEDPSRLPFRPGWDGSDFVIPEGAPPEARRHEQHRSGLRLGFGLGGSVEGDVQDPPHRR